MVFTAYFQLWHAYETAGERIARGLPCLPGTQNVKKSQRARILRSKVGQVVTSSDCTRAQGSYQPLRAASCLPGQEGADGAVHARASCQRWQQPPYPLQPGQKAPLEGDYPGS